MRLYDLYCFVFFKQKTAYEVRISDWSSDVCSSDLATSPGRTPRRSSQSAPAVRTFASVAGSTGFSGIHRWRFAPLGGSDISTSRLPSRAASASWFLISHEQTSFALSAALGRSGTV